MASWATKTLRVTFLGAERLTNSESGNPQWTLNTSEGHFKTEKDADVNYSIHNYTGGPGSLIGKTVTLHLYVKSQRVFKITKEG